MNRDLGPTATYVLTFVQIALDGQRDQIADFTLTPALTWTDATVTSPADNTTYKPGDVTFTGTGTPGAAITARNQWGTLMGSTTVGTDGKWTFTRNLGPSADYVITIQAKKGANSNTITLNLNSPKFQALQLTAPTEGETYTPVENYTFSGTATPYSTISATTKLGTSVFTATADGDGNWSYTRAYGPTNTYQLVLTQTTNAGTSDSIEFTWAPNPTK